jgi:hypothetical protein
MQTRQAKNHQNFILWHSEIRALIPQFNSDIEKCRRANHRTRNSLRASRTMLINNYKQHILNITKTFEKYISSPNWSPFRLHKFICKTLQRIGAHIRLVLYKWRNEYDMEFYNECKNVQRMSRNLHNICTHYWMKCDNDCYC